MESPPSIRSLLALLGRGSVLYGLSSLLQKVLSIVLLPVYTRFLPPGEFGEVALLNAAALMIKPVYMMGFGAALLWTVLYRREDETRAFSTVFLHVMIQGALLSLVLALAARPVTGLLLGSPERAVLVRILAGTLLAELAEALLLVRLRIHREARAFAAFCVARLLVGAALQVGFVVGWRLGVEGIVLAHGLNAAAFGLVAMRRLVPHLRPVFAPDLWRPMLGYGLPLVPAAMAGTVLTVSDRYFIRVFRGAEELGLYALGYNVGMAINLVVLAIGLAWTPEMLDLARSGAKVSRRFSFLTTHYVLVVGFAALSLSLLGPPVIRLATPAEFHAAGAVVVWVALAYAVSGLSHFANVGIKTQGKTRYTAVMVTAAAALNLALNAWLVPRYGMFGAAGSTLACYAVLAAATLVVNYRLWPMPYQTVRLTKLTVVLAAVYALGMQVQFPRAWLTFAARVPVLLAVPLGLWIVRFYRDTEAAAIRATVATWARPAHVPHSPAPVLPESELDEEPSP